MVIGKKKKRLDSADDLALVYSQYKPELEGYAARRVDSREEAEDIVHDVFYKLARIDLLESPIEYVSAWLYEAVSNRITDRRRKKRELPMTETADDGRDEYFLDFLSLFYDPGDDPETAMRNELIRQEIDRALGELPDEQRTVFELTEFEGFSYKEIAASTGVGVPALLSRKHYAVKHLRRRLREFYLEED